MDNSNGPWQKDKKKKKRSGSRRPSTCKYCKIRPSPRSRGTMWTAGTSSSRLSSQVEAKTNRLRLRTVGAPAGTLVRAEGSSCWWALHGSKHCRHTRADTLGFGGPSSLEIWLKNSLVSDKISLLSVHYKTTIEHFDLVPPGLGNWLC